MKEMKGAAGVKSVELVEEPEAESVVEFLSSDDVESKFSEASQSIMFWVSRQEVMSEKSLLWHFLFHRGYNSLISLI